MAAVEVGEQLLVASFQPVVELLRQAFLDLGNHVVGVEAAEALLQQHAQQVGIAQIGCHCLGDAGVLHLHRHRTLLAGGRVEHDCAVHLADAGCGDRLRIPLHEQLLGPRAQVAFDHLCGQLGAHRGSVRLQLSQRFSQRAR